MTEGYGMGLEVTLAMASHDEALAFTLSPRMQPLKAKTSGAECGKGAGLQTHWSSARNSCQLRTLLSCLRDFTCTAMPPNGNFLVSEHEDSATYGKLWIMRLC